MTLQTERPRKTLRRTPSAYHESGHRHSGDEVATFRTQKSPPVLQPLGFLPSETACCVDPRIELTSSLLTLSPGKRAPFQSLGQSPRMKCVPTVLSCQNLVNTASVHRSGESRLRKAIADVAVLMMAGLLRACAFRFPWPRARCGSCAGIRLFRHQTGDVLICTFTLGQLCLVVKRV